MSFASQVMAFESSAVQSTERVRKGATTDIFHGVIASTPVGNPLLWRRYQIPPGYTPGRLKGNWHASVGSQNRTNTDAVDPTGVRVASEVQSVVENSPADSTVYLTNAVEYAMRVENGHSTQTPPGGMVNLASAGMKGNVRKNVREEAVR